MILAFINKKFLSLMLILMSVAGLVSCLGDEKISGSDDSGEDRPQTRMELAFAVGSTAFSGENIDATGVYEAGDAFEYKVNKVRLYFFRNDKDRTLAYVRDYYWNTHPSPDADHVVRYKVQDKITDFADGTYEILAVANFVDQNLPAKDGSKLTMSDLLDHIDAKTYSMGEVTGFYTNGVLMTNRASDRVILSKDRSTDGKSVKVEISLERCIAKVRISRRQESFPLYDNDSTVYASITPSSYQLVNLMSEFYLFRHVGTYNNEQEAFAPNKQFDINENYGAIPPVNGYCIDPRFHEKTLDPVKLSVTPQYLRNGYLTTTEWAPYAKTGEKQTVYILSNNCYSQSQVANYVTGLHIQADVRPAKVILENGEELTNTDAIGQVYEVYQYKCKFYDGLSTMIKYNPELAVVREWPGSSEYDSAEDRQEFERNLYTGYRITHHTRFGASLRCYYFYWIRHDLDSTDPMTPMRYGIVRNNVYDLQLVNIKVPGIGNFNPKRTESVDKELMTIRARVGCWTSN